jgi:protein-L-isoaspartate(D-aspartate) O-methyltransferase
MGFASVAVPMVLWQDGRTKTRPKSLAMNEFAQRRQMMVDTQVRPSDVTKFPIIAAMLAVPREVYVPAARREAAYVGENLAISPGRVLLEPRSLAKLLDALDVQPTETVLDLGCGLGYSSAVLARLAGAVVAVEADEAMAADAQNTLSAEGVDNAAVLVGKLQDGAAKHGPYDVIILQGGVEVMPDALTQQLQEGGRIGAIFMEGGLGVARIGYKIDGKINWRDVFNATAPVLDGFQRRPSFLL